MSKPGRFTTTRGAERGDPALALCSADARLLWFELRLLMAESSEPGFLLVEGARPTPAQIAALAALDTAQVKESLRELEGRGVFVRDKRGVVYCREIVRLEKARADGRRGGNPLLTKRAKDKGAKDPGAAIRMARMRLRRKETEQEQRRREERREAAVAVFLADAEPEGRA